MTIELILYPVKIGRFRAMYGDRELCVSKQPFFDAARVLLAEGVEPTVELTACHSTGRVVAMCSTVGEAARWMVVERDRGGLRRELWRPRPKADPSYGGSPETASEQEEGE